MNPSENSQSPAESSEAMSNHHLNATNSLRQHLGRGENPGDKSAPTPPSPGQAPIIWVEKAPPSPRGANCRLNCGEKILQGEYRIAVNPGQYGYRGNQDSDYYHIHCFEHIADFSQADFLVCVLPVNHRFARVRNVSITSLMDGNYLLDVGAERLVLQWKYALGRLIDQRDGVEREPLNPILSDLLLKAGSSKYVPQKPPNMDDSQYDRLRTTFAPVESDGPDDSQEWSLSEQYMSIRDDNPEALKERHSLSEMLEAWQFDRFLATSNELNEKGQKLKEELSPKAIRAIKRLSTTLLPFEGSSY